MVTFTRDREVTMDSRCKLLIFFLAAAIVLGGVSECDDVGPFLPDGAVCNGSESRSCNCIDNSWGVQTCNTNGSAWSQCDCHSDFSGPLESYLIK